MANTLDTVAPCAVWKSRSAGEPIRCRWHEGSKTAQVVVTLRFSPMTRTAIAYNFSGRFFGGYNNQ